MKQMFEQVKPKRLSDGAMEQVLGLVREGKLPPGAKLPPERELITLLGVSRTPLREAIRILETKGVLRVVPGQWHLCVRRAAAAGAARDRVRLAVDPPP